MDRLSTKKGFPEEKIEKYKLNKSFAIVISGIRRCGKSTLLNQVLKSK